MNALTDPILPVFELPILTVVGRRCNVAVKLLPFIQREGGGGALFAYGNQAQPVCEVVRGEVSSAISSRSRPLSRRGTLSSGWMRLLRGLRPPAGPLGLPIDRDLYFKPDPSPKSSSGTAPSAEADPTSLPRLRVGGFFLAFNSNLLSTAQRNQINESLSAVVPGVGETDLARKPLFTLCRRVKLG